MNGFAGDWHTLLYVLVCERNLCLKMFWLFFGWKGTKGRYITLFVIVTWWCSSRAESPV